MDIGTVERVRESLRDQLSSGTLRDGDHIDLSDNALFEALSADEITYVQKHLNGYVGAACVNDRLTLPRQYRYKLYPALGTNTHRPVPILVVYTFHLQQPVINR